MAPHSFLQTFGRKLGYWSLHCVFNALPSFAIALFVLDFKRYPAGIAAMVMGVGTFVILYALATSIPGPLSESRHILARSLRLGTRIRAMISILSLIAFGCVWIFRSKASAMLIPDLWCGLASGWLLNQGARVLGYGSDIFIASDARMNGFAVVYAMTVLEGLILSGILLMISFFAAIFLQLRGRRRAFASENPVGFP